jgi:hypothetical protein
MRTGAASNGITLLLRSAGELLKLLPENDFTGHRVVKVSLTFATHQSNDRSREARRDGETPNDFLEVLPRLTKYPSERESLTNQAASGV